MKVTSKYTIPTERFSKLGLHKAGVFAVAQLVNLSSHKIVMTAREDKKGDLIVTSVKTNKRFYLKISVSDSPTKTIPSYGTGLTWILTKGHEDLVTEDLYYCFVHAHTEGEVTSFRFFVIPSKTVAQYLKESFNYWLSEKSDRDKNNKVRVFILVSSKDELSSNVKTLLQEDYEDAWNLLT